MNLVLFDSRECSGRPEDEIVLPLTDQRAKHLLTVLKLDEKGRFRAGLINGPRGSAELTRLTGTELRVRFRPEEPPPANAPLYLLLGHPRPIQLQRVLRDLAAIGIAEVVVSHTELGERSYFQSSIWKDDTVSRLLIEGCAQGGGTCLPGVVREHTLKRALARVETLNPAPATRLFLHPEAGGIRLGEAGELNPPVVLGVGSERGWTEAEVALLENHAYSRVQFGDRVLRSETAAIVGAGVLLGRLGLL